MRRCCCHGLIHYQVQSNLFLENQLNQKLAALRAELESRLVNSAPAEVEKDSSATGKAATGAQEVVKQSRAIFEPQVVSTALTEKKTQEVLLASGALIVRDLAEQGVDFAYEAEVLQILARDNELAEEYTRTVRSFANAGISGKNQLVRKFQKIFAELNGADLKNQSPKEILPENAKWTDKVMYWLKKAFIAQKSAKKPVFTPENDEVWDLVNDGSLQAALNTMKASEKYAKMDSVPLEEWKAQVERYVEFNHAISGLIMNALANIRLKEMEHIAK